METLEMTINKSPEASQVIIIPDFVLCAECQEYVPLEETQMFGDGKYYCIDGCEKRV